MSFNPNSITNYACGGGYAIGYYAGYVFSPGSDVIIQPLNSGGLANWKVGPNWFGNWYLDGDYNWYPGYPGDYLISCTCDVQDYAGYGGPGPDIELKLWSNKIGVGAVLMDSVRMSKESNAGVGSPWCKMRVTLASIVTCTDPVNDRFYNTIRAYGWVTSYAIYTGPTGTAYDINCLSPWFAYKIAGS